MVVDVLFEVGGLVLYGVFVDLNLFGEVNLNVAADEQVVFLTA